MRDRPPAGARHRRARRGRGHRPDHVAGLQVRPERRARAPTRDLDKAADYLARRGQADGVTIKTIVSQGEYATSVNEAQNLQAQLAEAKHHPRARGPRVGAYVDRWVAADFDAAVALNGGRPDPDGMYGRYFTSTGNLNKVAGYSSPELDALFAAGQGDHRPGGAQGRSTTQISDELENNAAWIWLFTSYTYTATTAERAGLRPDGQRLAAVPAQTSLDDVGCARRRDPRHASATRASVPAASRGRRAHPARGRGARVRHAPGHPRQPDHRRPRHRGRGADAGAAGGAASRTTASTSRWSCSSSPGSATCSPATSASPRAHQASVLELTARLAAGHARAGRPVDRARAGDRHPARHAVGVEAELARATASARWSASPASRSRRSCSARRCSSVFASWFGYNPNGQAFATFFEDPWLNLQQMLLPGARARLRDRRADHAHDADRGARGPLEDFIRTARAKGVPPRRLAGAARAAQRARPDRDDDRPAVRLPARRRRRRRADLLGARASAARCCSASSRRSTRVVQSTVLVIALAFVLVNLLTDVLYRVIDPRVRAVMTRRRAADGCRRRRRGQRRVRRAGVARACCAARAG